MAVIIQGSAQLIVPRLSAPTAPSNEGIAIERWAHKPARLARMDRLCAVALATCDAALIDAGRSPADAGWVPERSGIVLGTAFGCHGINETYYRGYLAGGIATASPRDFAYTLPSSPVGEISIHHRILGPASTAVGGMSAAIDALTEASRHLDAGRADLMIVAAVDVSTPLLDRMGAASPSDSAAALVLTRGDTGPRIERTVSRFCAGAPFEAARACLDALAPADRVYLPRGMIELGPAGSRLPLDETTHGVAPLLALRAASIERLASAVVVVADESGQAAAVRLVA
jgi:hypothetical protein